MAEKPNTLFLIAVASIGTAILSALNVEGSPVAVLIIPFALFATYLDGLESGIVVGIVSSVLAGIVVNRIDHWEIVVYALAVGVTIIGLETLYPKTKNTLYYLLFAALGTLAFEILNDIYTGNSIILRPEHFLGTNPASGIRLVFNVLATGLLLSYYPSEKENKKEKK